MRTFEGPLFFHDFRADDEDGRLARGHDITGHDKARKAAALSSGGDSIFAGKHDSEDAIGRPFICRVLGPSFQVFGSVVVDLE